MLPKSNPADSPNEKQSPTQSFEANQNTAPSLNRKQNFSNRRQHKCSLPNPASLSSTLLPFPSYPGSRFTFSWSHVKIHRTTPIIFAFHSARSPTFIRHVRTRIGAWSLAAGANAIVGARLTCAMDHADTRRGLLLLLQSLLLLLKREVRHGRGHAVNCSG